MLINGDVDTAKSVKQRTWLLIRERSESIYPVLVRGGVET